MEWVTLSPGPMANRNTSVDSALVGVLIRTIQRARRDTQTRYHIHDVAICFIVPRYALHADMKIQYLSDS